jgi:UDP-2-acetamido-3-amino-2,3-dideoxy-glucuronate N-acetyltransferase
MSQIHEQALIDDGAIIGPGTRVWAFAHVLAGAIVGADCNICDHTFIESGVVIGDRVTLKSGVYLWDGLNIEDDVFIGPAAVFTNDLRPRSKQYPSSYERTTLLQGSSIGANATILAGVTVGKWALVGAASVVTRSVPDFAAVWGVPASLKYWVCKCANRISFDSGPVHVCECGVQLRLDQTNHTVSLCN